MQAIVCADIEGSFCGSYARPCGGIISFPHELRLAVLVVNGLVDNFQHADSSVIAVRMDDVGHPFEKFVRALILVVNVEAW